MNAPKFTPGPWRLHVDGVAVFGSNGEQVIDATVCSPNLTQEEIRMNARLIAAAPDMYAALDACMREGRNPDTYEAGERALAKARGES